VKSVNRSTADDPYELVSPLLALADDWLALSEGANIPLELAVHELRSRGEWRLSISRTSERIEGLSVVMPGAHWYLDALRPTIAEMLSNMAVIHGRRPATLTASQEVGGWLRGFLSETGGIRAERAVKLLRCDRAPVEREGRWAADADLTALREYEKGIDPDRLQYMDTSWEVLAAIRGLAVFTSGDLIVGSIRRYGPAPSYAAISDLFVLPDANRAEIAARLAGFVIGEILTRRKVVYVLVDESDVLSLASYRHLGFEDQGSFYRAYLE